jgi:hypothetical protein
MEKRAELSGGFVKVGLPSGGGGRLSRTFPGEGPFQVADLGHSAQRYPGGRVWKEKIRRQEMPSGSALVADGMMIQEWSG